ncbi:MAG: hypothetical protein ACRDHX_01060, partial [Chloroflexota bacterium]
GGGSTVPPPPPTVRLTSNPCAILRPLLDARTGFDNSGGASLIDSTLQFHSCLEVLAYAPRALELTFLNPTPNLWLHPGGSTGAARYLSALDALLLWLLLPGLTVGVVHAVVRPTAMRIALAVFVVLLGFALGFAVSNFGTLFRLRLEVILPATILAVEGWALILAWLAARLRPLGVSLPLWLSPARERGALGMDAD